MESKSLLLMPLSFMILFCFSEIILVKLQVMVSVLFNMILAVNRSFFLPEKICNQQQLNNECKNKELS